MFTKYIYGGLVLVILGLGTTVYLKERQNDVLTEANDNLKLQVSGLKTEISVLKENAKTQEALSKAKDDALDVLRKANSYLKAQAKKANEIRQAIKEGNYENLDIDTSLRSALDLLRRFNITSTDSCGEGEASSPAD